MPAKSKKQKHFFQLALGVKTGSISKKEVSKDVVDAAESMKKSDLEKYAKEPVKERVLRIIEEEIQKILSNQR